MKCTAGVGMNVNMTACLQRCSIWQINRYIRIRQINGATPTIAATCCVFF